MKDQLLAELAKIVQAVTILSPTSFSFAGQVVPQSDLAMQQLQSLYPSQNPLITQLQQQLYSSCYCRRFTGHLLEEAPGMVEDGSFLQELSEANSSQERWDSG